MHARDASRRRPAIARLYCCCSLAGRAVDGINDQGLCITYDYGFTIDDAQAAGPPISAAITAALEQCGTVAEAARLITARPRWGGGLLMLADPSGDIASLELSSTRCQLRRPAAGEDVLFHTNAFHTAPMRAVQVSPDAVFTGKEPPVACHVRPLDSSMLRCAIRALLAGNRPLGWDELTEIMSDHGPTGAAQSEGLCVHSDYWNTTACLQFEPQARRLRVAYTSTCQARFQEFGL